MGRDAPRPDASWRSRRAAKGKGGAIWRRDRSHAQRPVLGASMARTYPLPAASTVAPNRTSVARVIHRGSRAYARRVQGFYGFKDSGFLGL